jgi:hypothetical protein
VLGINRGTAGENGNWENPRVLIRQAVLDGIVAGTVDRAFRRWRTPMVRPGSTMRTAVGVLVVDDVTAVRSVSAADARLAGYATVAALKSEMDSRPGTLYRIMLRYSGPDPRIALRADVSIDDGLVARVSKLDWAVPYLRMIEVSPGVRAPDLAARVGQETKKFKLDVRKLKELGLTESLTVGYRLSPRGAALLRVIDP